MLTANLRVIFRQSFAIGFSKEIKVAASEFIVPQKYLRLGQKEVEPVLIETVVHLECKRLDGKGCSLLGRHDT